MARYTRYLIPSLSSATLPLVESALRACGYTPSASGEMFLHAVVRRMVHGTGTFAEVFQSGEGPWDPSFARRLSAVTDGFVSTSEYWSVPEEYGEGLFFAGRTLQARSWPPGLDCGPERVIGEQMGMHVEDVYLRRFGDLCNADVLLRQYGEIVAEQTWRVTPHVVDFKAEEEGGLTRILVGNAPPEREEQMLSITAVPGWQRRLRRTPESGMAYVELRGNDTFDTAILQQLSAAVHGTALMFQVPGAARTCRWASAYRGAVDESQETERADELLRGLYASCFLIGDVPGMLFGPDEGTWVE